MSTKVDIMELGRKLKSRRAILVAGTLIGLHSLRLFNSWLSRRASNNGITDKTWNWNQEIVLLTGGSGGIGSVIAKRLAERRVKVIIVDVEPPTGKLADNQFFYAVDITSSKEIKAFAEKIRTEHGEPTVIINNAGIGNNKPILDLPESGLRKIFDVNVIAHYLLLQEFMPALVRANHGHIVTVASMASFSTQASNVDYACTKASALVLHEGLGQELKHIYKAPRLRTSVVHPSWVRTPMIQRLIDNGSFTDPVLEPEDVADAIVRQLYSGYGAQIIVPSSLWWVSAIRGFPSWLQEFFRDAVSTTLLKAARG